MNGRRFRVRFVAALGLALPASWAAAAATPTPAAGPLSFLGAYVGMSREAWAALPPPGGRAAEIRCTAPAASGQLNGAAAPDPAPAAGPITCAYIRRFGRYALPVTVRLSNGLFATHLRYTFQGGRLQRIAYRMSVDAYDRLTADLHARLGNASGVRRDSVPTAHGLLPRVSRTWRTPAGAVQIVDPVSPYVQLQVRLCALDCGA